MEERRRFPRYHVPEDFTVAAEFPPRRQYCLKVKDIGIDGFSFATKEDISREAVFSLFIKVTDKEGRAAQISALANIVWRIYDEETALYAAGAQFLGLNDSDRELLQHFFGSLALKGRG